VTCGFAPGARLELATYRLVARGLVTGLSPQNPTSHRVHLSSCAPRGARLAIIVPLWFAWESVRLARMRS
jgi:hypothetical protein